MMWKHTAGFSIAMIFIKVTSFAPARLDVLSPCLRRSFGALSKLSHRGLMRGVAGQSGCDVGADVGVRVRTRASLFQGRLDTPPPEVRTPAATSRRRIALGIGRGLRTGAPLRMVAEGQLATIDFSLRQEDGSPYEACFDQGRVRLVVGGGGFAPFLHRAVRQMEPGEAKVVGVPPKEAFGEHDANMTAILRKDSAPGEISVGTVLQLWTGQKATVVEVGDESFKIDWNPKGAGTSLVMDVKVLDAASTESVLKEATFAGGCFWGLELAFQRASGVVSTKVGYAQGDVKRPSYSDVCTGRTGHTESVRVLYDPSDTTYKNLLGMFFDRHDPTQANGQGNDKGTQYRAGVYFHDDEQRKEAEAFFEDEKKKRGLKKIATELEEAKEFYDAEEEHQQYLQKGGQDARKEATETIRCYG